MIISTEPCMADHLQNPFPDFSLEFFGPKCKKRLLRFFSTCSQRFFPFFLMFLFKYNQLQGVMNDPH